MMKFNRSGALIALVTASALAIATTGISACSSNVDQSDVQSTANAETVDVGSVTAGPAMASWGVTTWAFQTADVEGGGLELIARGLDSSGTTRVSFVRSYSASNAVAFTLSSFDATGTRTSTGSISGSQADGSDASVTGNLSIALWQATNADFTAMQSHYPSNGPSGDDVRAMDYDIGTCIIDIIAALAVVAGCILACAGVETGIGMAACLVCLLGGGQAGLGSAGVGIMDHCFKHDSGAPKDSGIKKVDASRVATPVTASPLPVAY